MMNVRMSERGKEEEEDHQKWKIHPKNAMEEKYLKKGDWEDRRPWKLRKTKHLEGNVKNKKN